MVCVRASPGVGSNTEQPAREGRDDDQEQNQEEGELEHGSSEHDVFQPGNLKEAKEKRLMRRLCPLKFWDGDAFEDGRNVAIQ